MHTISSSNLEKICFIEMKSMVLRYFLAKSEALHSGSNKNLTLWTAKEFVSIFKTQTNHSRWEEDKPIQSWEKNQYLNFLDITIRTPQEFEKRIHDPNPFVWSIPYADAELWRNQKRVFSSRQYWFTRQYRFDLIPWLKKHCTYDKDRECGNRLRDVMFTGFSTFDIE